MYAPANSGKAVASFAKLSIPPDIFTGAAPVSPNVDASNVPELMLSSLLTTVLTAKVNVPAPVLNSLLKVVDAAPPIEAALAELKITLLVAAAPMVKVPALLVHKAPVTVRVLPLSLKVPLD